MPPYRILPTWIPLDQTATESRALVKATTSGLLFKILIDFFRPLIPAIETKKAGP